MDYGYHNNIVLPDDAPIAPEASWEDIAVVANPYAVAYNRPDLSVYNQGKGKPLNPNDKEWNDIFKVLPPEHKNLFLQSSSIEDFGRRVERFDYIQKSTSNFRADESYTKYAAALATGVLDPTILIPIGGVAKQTYNATETTKVISKSMAIGAAYGVGYEAQMDAQDRDTSYLHSGFFGAGLGLVGGAIGARIAHNQVVSSNKTFELFPEQLVPTTTTPYIPTPIKVERDKIKGKGKKGKINKQETVTYLPLVDDSSSHFKDNPHITIDDTIPEAPRVTNNTPNNLFDIVPDQTGAGFVPSFIQSPIQKVMNSSVDGIRAIGFKLAPMAYSLKANGKAILQGITAWDVKKEVEGVKNTHLYELTDEFKKARELGYNGAEADFMSTVFKQYIKEVTDWHNIPKGMRQSFKASAPSVDIFYRYFNTMLKRGKGLGVKVLQDIDDTTPYFPVMYDFQKINTTADNELVVMFRDALQGDIRNKDLTSEQLQEASSAITKLFKDQSYSLNFYDKSAILPADLRLSGQLKERTLHLDHSKLHNIIDTDGVSVLERYNYNQSGVYSIHSIFGTDDIGEIVTKAVNEARAKGLDITDDFKHLETVLRDLRGTLRMPENPTGFGIKAANNISAYNNISNGWFFGLNSISEVANVLWGTSWKHMFSGDIGTSIKQAVNLIHSGKFEEATPLAKSIISLGYLQDGVTTARTAMFEAGSGITNHVLDKGGLLDTAQHKIFKGTLLYTITDALEYFAGAGAVRTIMDIADKGILSTQDTYKLSRWGISHEDAVSITSKIKELGINNINNLDLNRLPDVERLKLETAISRTISTSVLQADTLHLPEFMLKGNPLAKILTQWMKFPLIATNTLLQRGIREDKAGLIVAAAMSGGVYASMAYLREEALIGLGVKDENKRKYDATTEEGRKNLMLKSVQYMGATGMLVPVAEYVAQLYGVENKYGRVHSAHLADFLGPTVGKADDLISTFPDAFRALVEGHPPADRKTYAAYQQLVFFLSMPIIGEVYNDWADKEALKN